MKILVAGPPGGGKSSFSQNLSTKLSLSLFKQDDEKVFRFQRMGHTAARAELIYDKGGAIELHKYEAQFEAEDLHTEIDKRDFCIFDLSGGILLQDTEKRKEMLYNCFENSDICYILLPHSENITKCYQTLLKRLVLRSLMDARTAHWLDNGGDELLHSLLRSSLSLYHKKIKFIDTRKFSSFL